MKYIILVLFSLTANAGPKINGIHYQDPIKTESIDQTEQAIFTASDGLEWARFARIQKHKKQSQEMRGKAEECFLEMKESAQDGECGTVFWSEESKCNPEGEEPNGCFENKWFRKKAVRLGFKVKKTESPTDDEEDRCASIRISWCKARK